MNYTINKIDEGFWSIEENGVRSFLLEGGGKALLIDTGFGTGNLKTVVDGLTQAPIQLVNTHADPDHIGCNQFFDHAYLHPAEFDRFRFSEKKGINQPLFPLWEGDILDIGVRKLEVILIPGHTPGSIALLDRENRILFGGDSVQSGPIFMFASGRSIDAYICSMEKLINMSNLFDTVYASHGELTVPADSIPTLADGARKVLTGEVKGTEPPRNLPCKLYQIGKAKFLY